MIRRSLALWAALAFLPPVLAVPAVAQTPAGAPQKAASPKAGDTQPAQSKARSLMVLNARKADLANGKLSLDGVSASAIVFADRPIRRAGYVHTADLVKLWASNKTFAKDPPNATVSAFTKDGTKLADAVVVLQAPKLDGDRLTFDVKVLEGDLGGVDGPAAVFIDTIWFGFGGDQGFHYLGANPTTTGTSPAFGTPGDTSNPSGWPNPSPNGSASSSPPPPPNSPPLSAPPGYTPPGDK
ncbi:MAG: hypothetical protein JSR90_12630 [Proteobacteria bacterium]|nr:hypothetical protein [Pseudomonadota bacterium]